MEAPREVKIAVVMADNVGNVAVKDTLPIPVLLALLIIKERERATETEARTIEMLK